MDDTFYEEYNLPFFYGAQAEQFVFAKFPMVLLTDPHYDRKSMEAKVLYMLLLRRQDLSAANGWLDEEGVVYIVFTIYEIMKLYKCGEHKALRLLSELEDPPALIMRKRMGLGKPNRIYVKNFIPDCQNGQFLNCHNSNSGTAKTAIAELPDQQGSYINWSKTENSDTDHNLILSGDPGSDEMRKRQSYENYFRESLDYDVLLMDNPTERETLEGILDILVDTCCSTKDWILMGGDKKPMEVVRSRLMKLNFSHIEYVLNGLKTNTTRVRYMNQYLLASLYNAPATISPYYQSWVNNDMAGGRF